MTNWWNDEERLKQWYKDTGKIKDEYGNASKSLTVSEYWKKYRGICHRDGCEMRLYYSSAGSFYECPTCGWAVMDSDHIKITNKETPTKVVEYDNDEIPW